MKILNYLFEMLCLANQQIKSEKHFKFNCNAAIQNQNEGKGHAVYLLLLYTLYKWTRSHLNLKNAKTQFLVVFSFLMSYYCVYDNFQLFEHWLIRTNILVPLVFELTDVDCT